MDKNAIDPRDVIVRNFRYDDAERLAEYWSGNSEEFWRERGVDKAKLRSKSEYQEIYKKALDQTGDIQTLATIVFRGAAIGVHGLTDLVPGDSAVFHAHIWHDANRRSGIATISYLKAADFFLRKLGLAKIVFKTPTINVAANRIKEKLGIPCLGATVFESPILFRPLPAKLYELDAKTIAELRARNHID